MLAAVLVNLLVLHDDRSKLSITVCTEGGSCAVVVVPGMDHMWKLLIVAGIAIEFGQDCSVAN